MATQIDRIFRRGFILRRCARKPENRYDLVKAAKEKRADWGSESTVKNDIRELVKLHWLRPTDPRPSKRGRIPIVECFVTTELGRKQLDRWDSLVKEYVSSFGLGQKSRKLP